MSPQDKWKFLSRNLKNSYYSIYYLFNYSAYGRLALAFTLEIVTRVTKQTLNDAQTLAYTLKTILL